MDLKTKVVDLHNTIPLPLKMVVLTIIISLSVWVVLDYYQTKKFKKIHYAHLTEKLHKEAAETRSGFNRYVNNFQDNARLCVTQKIFGEYIEKQGWAAADRVQIKYNSQSPEWFPKRSVIRTLRTPHHAILLDPAGRTREVYNSRKDPAPPCLLNPLGGLIRKSRDQIFITSIDETTYAISSATYSDSKGETLATLILASPIDSEFLRASLKYFSEEHLVALLSADEDPRILTSSNLEELPVGTPISILQNHYLVAEKKLLDYGASEPQIKLANFVSLVKIKNMTDTSILASRQEIAVTAFILIIVFALIMYWITRHISSLSKSINDFSRHTLGMEPGALKKGDQLHILKERFQKLTMEIIKARETIKHQAEEKTRLIVNGAFDAIVTTDDKGIISTWNQAAGALFGWTAEETVGKPIYDIIVQPEPNNEFRDTITNIINENKGVGNKCQVIIYTCHRNGRKMQVEFSVSSARQGKGSILIFIMRDTTERSRSEKRIHHLLMTLRKAKEEWEKTFDTVNEQILLVDRELNIIRCNKSFAESVKASPHDLIGRKFHEFILCEDSWLSGIKEGKEQMERIEVETYDRRWLYISIMPVHDNHGNFLYTIVTATDITELKKAQQTLMKSKQELNERVNELESFYEMAVNREIKMIRLKRKIKKLETKNGNGNTMTAEDQKEKISGRADISDNKTSGHTNQSALFFLDDISAKR